jgi:lipopolysaccharide transport system ATP-binding protein
MPDTIIQTNNLGKRYILHHQHKERHTNLREVITQKVSRIRSQLFYRGNKSRFGSDLEEFWALKDVSFEVKHGEVIGIIGRNGAGKTTLLKILSRITEPSTGRFNIKGRVASLLEVGTGFHPELTGRENIFLNGAILGMTRQEIKKKFDEIVDFAEIEKFLDTPVKRYSSGMYVRLAFAVAAHLEPEILVVDEVLAVGDADFQKKCLGKIGEVASGGRTVLFVSHNMAAINKLCPKVLWLDQGLLFKLGDSQQIVSEYLSSNAAYKGERVWNEGIANRGINELKIIAVRLINDKGLIASTLDARHPFVIETEYEISSKLSSCRIGFIVSTVDGTIIFAAYDADSINFAGTREPGKFRLKCTIPGYLLNPNRFTLSINAGIRGIKNLAYLENVLVFDVEDTVDIRAKDLDRHKGVIRPRLEWEQIHI